jgi:hypothetical protein
MSANFDLRKMLYKTIERTIPTTDNNTGYKILSFTDSNFLVNIHVTSANAIFSLYNVSGVTNSYEKLVIHKLNTIADFALDASNNEISILLTNLDGETIIENGTIKTEVIYGLISNLSIVANKDVETNIISGIINTDYSVTFFGDTIIVTDILKNTGGYEFSLPDVTENSSLVVSSQLTDTNTDVGTIIAAKADKVIPSHITSNPEGNFSLVQVNNQGIVTSYKSAQLLDINVPENVEGYLVRVSNGKLSYQIDNKQGLLGGNGTGGKIVKLNTDSPGDVGYLGIDSQPIGGSLNLITSGGLYYSLSNKQNILGGGPETFGKVVQIISDTPNNNVGYLGIDSYISSGSSNLITSGGVYISLDSKQDRLQQNQMNAVNSGITSTKVSDYDAYASAKQDTLTGAKFDAINSGITLGKVDKYDNYETNKQDKLTLHINGYVVDSVSNIYAPIDSPSNEAINGYVLKAVSGDDTPQWSQIATVNGSVLTIG